MFSVVTELSVNTKYPMLKIFFIANKLKLSHFHLVSIYLRYEGLY